MSERQPRYPQLINCPVGGTACSTGGCVYEGILKRGAGVNATEPVLREREMAVDSAEDEGCLIAPVLEVRYKEPSL